MVGEREDDRWLSPPQWLESPALRWTWLWSITKFLLNVGGNHKIVPIIYHNVQRESRALKSHWKCGEVWLLRFLTESNLTSITVAKMVGQYVQWPVDESLHCVDTADKCSVVFSREQPLFEETQRSFPDGAITNNDAPVFHASLCSLSLQPVSPLMTTTICHTILPLCLFQCLDTHNGISVLLACEFCRRVFALAYRVTNTKRCYTRLEKNTQQTDRTMEIRGR